MAMFAMLMMAAGVLISTLGGLIHQNGPDSLYGALDRFPHTDLLISNPGASFIVGICLLVTGLVCQPRRVM